MSQTHEESERGATYSTPRWLKVSGIISLVVILLIVLVLATGLGGEHGPGRHALSGGVGADPPPVSVTEDHAPPIEHAGQQP